MLQLPADYVIRHLGTNESKMKSCKQILDELTKFKCFIENLLPNTSVIMSKPITITDVAKVNITIRSLKSFSVVKHLKLSNGNRLIIDYININSIGNKFDELKYREMSIYLLFLKLI